MMKRRKSNGFMTRGSGDSQVASSTLRAQEAFALADYAIAQSDIAEREIQGHALTAGDKTRIGLLKHEIESMIGRKIDDGGHVIDPEDDSIRYTGKVSISESNRRWFAEHGTYGTVGEANAD